MFLFLSIKMRALSLDQDPHTSLSVCCDIIFPQVTFILLFLFQGHQSNTQYNYDTIYDMIPLDHLQSH